MTSCYFLVFLSDWHFPKVGFIFLCRLGTLLYLLYVCNPSLERESAHPMGYPYY